MVYDSLTRSLNGRNEKEEKKQHDEVTSHQNDDKRSRCIGITSVSD